MAPTDHDHRMPFDHESEAGSDDTDLTEEFWGTSRGWQPTKGHQEVAPTSHRDDTTGAIRAIREGVAAFRPQRVDLRDATGQVRRTRSHGGGPGPDDVERVERRAEASIGDLAAGHHDDPFLDDPFLDDPFLDGAFDSTGEGPATFADPDDPDDTDRELVPLSAREPASSRVGLGAVDPLLARFGAIALVGVLLVPVALALRPSDSTPDGVRIESPAPTAAAAGADGAPATDPPQQADASTGETSAAAAEATADAEASTDVAAAPPEQVEVVAESAAPAAASESTGASSGDDAQTESAPVADTPDVDDQSATDGAIDDAATVDEPADRVVPSCPQTYTAGAGDSWYRIADAAGVSPGAVMTENRATGDTVILPGDEICLPAGATVPSPPPAPADPSPATTTPAATTPATTTPATTSPPTTAATSPPASVEEVKALIRATWPAEEHETAMMIANRESRFNPRADNNWCCYGVFQIYFTVHQSWLDDFGVYQASDLFDAEKNIAAAYHLYQQSGGWGPWGF